MPSSFARNRARKFDDKQTSRITKQKAIHVSALRLATRGKAFVIIALVIGRWRDVTVWVFYQTQAYYFRKFWCEKNLDESNKDSRFRDFQGEGIALKVAGSVSWEK